MCIKKLWQMIFGSEPDPIPPTGDKIALLFGINEYGGGNDLRGCINDINDVEKKLNSDFPGFEIRKFTDGEVTKERFKAELLSAIQAMPPDSTVVIHFDSCFSQSATRLVNGDKNRFYDMGLPPKDKIRSRIFRTGESMKWLAFSGCGEHQTSADAYFNGRYNGAYTYFSIPCMISGTTYQDEITKLSTFLPSEDYDQIPSLEGPDYLKLRKLLEGPTLLVWYSGHGTYLTDNNGEEADGYDEAIYLIDGALRDDDISEILSQIK